MNLTPHFTLEELVHSSEAVRRGLKNDPPPEVLPRLGRLAQLLERVRMVLGVPVVVSSGYRSPAVNRAVGGSSKSAHMEGRASDFIAPGFGTPQEVAKHIRDSGIAFDQLIYEGTWVHIAIPPDGETPRMQVLTAQFNGGPATYIEGIA